jgi:hypothetical protein
MQPLPRRRFSLLSSSQGPVENTAITGCTRHRVTASANLERGTHAA